MRREYSFRWRIALGLALFCIAIVGLYSFTIYRVVEGQEETLIDEIISEELDHLITQYGHDPYFVPAQSSNLYGYIVRDEVDRRALPPYLRDLADGGHEILVDGRELHVLARTMGDTRFYTAYDVSAHEERMQRFQWFLIVGLGVTALVAAVLGYALAGWLVRPISDLAHRVGRLQPLEDEIPLADRYREDELRRLARSFDRYRERVAALVRREQDFTAHVSHELRTPLTAIRTSCELLEADTGLAELARQRLARIRHAADRLSAIVRALLFLAREGRSSDAAEAVPLRACVEEVLEPLRERLRDRPVELRIEVDPKAMVRANRSALELVLANLFDNALAHTERGHVSVRYHGRVLTVEDSGRGIEGGDQPRIFDRFYRGATAGGHDGLGLGLALVKRLSDLYGWRIAVESQVQVGTRISIELPA